MNGTFNRETFTFVNLLRAYEKYILESLVPITLPRLSAILMQLPLQYNAIQYNFIVSV